MSAFKRINKSDVVTLPYVANKQWKINAADFNKNGIYVYRGMRLTGSFNYYTDEITNGEYNRLVYNTINHLLYQQYKDFYFSTGSKFQTLYYNDLSEYRPTGSYFDFAAPGEMHKSFPTGTNDQITVLSIPQRLLGTGIKPGTFDFKSNYNVIDDSKGNIYAITPISGGFGLGFNSGYQTSDLPTAAIGNIFYDLGIAVITDQFFLSVFSASYELNFQNEHLVYENIIKCTVLDREFNYSYNPSLLASTESAQLKGFVTSSYFSPYITSVGLYNDANELLAVAKLSQPLPTTSETDYNIIVRMDW